MNTLIPCTKCFEQSEITKTLILKEIPDDGIFHLCCDQGHETITLLQEQKFELLFDFGLSALCDGYPREAVTNFAAALERFYEFYIYFVCFKHNITSQQLEKCWKLVKSQSERQYGAYVFLYMEEHPNSEFPFIEEKKPLKEKRTWKEFRNDVVHKGYFASENEAIEYGELVYNFLQEQINELLTTEKENTGRAVAYYLKSIHDVAIKKHPSLKSISTLCMPTVISLSRESNQKTFEEVLNDFRDNPLRKIMRSVSR